MDLKKCRPSSKVLLQSGAILVGTFILVLIMEIQKGVSKEEITCIKRNSYEDGVKLEALEMQIEGEHHEKVQGHTYFRQQSEDVRLVLR